MVRSARVIFLLLSAFLADGLLRAQPRPLAGTAPLERQGDLATAMVDSIDTYLMKRLEASPTARARRWNYDFASVAAYERSVEPNRERFRRIIGAVDERVPFTRLTILNQFPTPATARRESQPADTRALRIESVRWPVLPGVEAEGLLLAPAGAHVAHVIVLPDADETPERLAGLDPAAPPRYAFARRLAESGCLVLIPVLIDRKDTWSGNPAISRLTNQPHREFIYRMAYEMGRHIIGYEVEKVLAAVDFFIRQEETAPIGVAGYGEGGLLALYSAAADPRIDAALVSGYFMPREGLWREPIYRDVWGLLDQFGDAEIASLVAPRGLVVEASRHPAVAGPPAEREGRRGAAPGSIQSPTLASVQGEFNRARQVYARLHADRKCALIPGPEGLAEPGSDQALTAFLKVLGVPSTLADAVPAAPPAHLATADHAECVHRQFTQLVAYTQGLVQRSGAERKKFWKRSDASSLDHWQAGVDWYRRYLDEEIFGKLPVPDAPLRAETRLRYDTPQFTGYDVVIPLLDDVFASGALLVPKDLKPGEKRPLVVCQHGLEGRPEDTIDPPDARTGSIYARFAAALAQQGFIVYAPQNPYIGGERFRVLLRKAHPLKLTLYSFITAQNRRSLDWLVTLPFVDAARIGYYGLSYGGKSAMRIPPVDPRYAAVVCSGDFNEWIWKITSVEAPFSYMFTQEYDMLEFDLGNTFNYSDLAAMIAPRPFMVERGHRDGVGIDEWVAYEFARVRRFYDEMGLDGRAQIEYFNGPHQIHGVGTYEFLHRWLNWPIR
jgi:dienelactone hydrolase